MIKIASQWILEHSKIKFLDSFMVQGITFELMSLSEDNIKKARELETSQEIIELSANGGIAINKNRMIEDESLVNSLAAYWQHEEILAYEDPTIMFSVGEKVCELSGLSEVLSEMILDEDVAAEAEEKELAEMALAEEKKEAEEEAYIIDGDKKLPDISLGQLQDDADKHHAA